MEEMNVIGIARYWTREDVEFLLDLLFDHEVIQAADGEPEVRHIPARRVFLGVNELGMPYIQSIEGARHCGFGVFVAETAEYEVSFDGGGGMSRTPSGKGWTALSIRRGSYPYDFEAHRATLQAILDADPWGQVETVLNFVEGLVQWN